MGLQTVLLAQKIDIITKDFLIDVETVKYKYIQQE
jgi:hypothetical protein